MGKSTADGAYKYSLISVIVLGIFGNTLIIISIFKRRRLLTNNYYFLVLHLALCDFSWLVIILFYVSNHFFIEKPFFPINSIIYCLINGITYVFQVAGICMMMIIAALRYRATVHPFKSAISRRKLKIVCGLGYIPGLMIGYGAGIPECFVQQENVAYWKFRNIFGLLLYCAPPLLMAVLYFKVCQALFRQDKILKSFGYSPRTQSTSSSFVIMRHIRNRRTFLVCLCTVLCYGVGNLPSFVNRILKIPGENYSFREHYHIEYLAHVLRIAGSHSVNPIIYGILDKKLLKWKLYHNRKGRTGEA